MGLAYKGPVQARWSLEPPQSQRSCRSEQQCEERSSFITWYPNEFLNTLHISKSSMATKHTVVALQEANMSGHDMYLYYTVPCKKFCKRLSGRDCPLSFKFTFLLLFPSWVSSFGVNLDQGGRLGPRKHGPTEAGQTSGTVMPFKQTIH
jgi:hypothetical protein